MHVPPVVLAPHRPGWLRSHTWPVGHAGPLSLHAGPAGASAPASRCVAQGSWMNTGHCSPGPAHSEIQAKQHFPPATHLLEPQAAPRPPAAPVLPPAPPAPPLPLAPVPAVPVALPAAPVWPAAPLPAAPVLPALASPVGT